MSLAYTEDSRWRNCAEFYCFAAARIFRFMPTPCGMWVKLVGVLLLAVWALVMAVLVWRIAGPES